MNFDPFIEWLKVNLLGPIQQLPVYPPNVVEGYSALLGAKSPGQMYESAAKDVMLNTLNSYADWIGNPLSLSHPIKIPGGMAGIMAGPKAKGYASALKKGKVFASPMDRAERFEINDRLMDTRPALVEKATMMKKLTLKELLGKQKIGTVGQLIKHKTLFKNYPQLKDVEIIYRELYPPGSAAYGMDLKGKPIITLGPMHDKAELTTSLLHELQHAIQEIEKRAMGGTTNMFLVGNKKYAALKRISQKRQLTHAELRKLYDMEWEASKRYFRIFGEMEARDTEARQMWTNRTRGQVAPYTSMTVRDISPDEITITKPEFMLSIMDANALKRSNLLGVRK